MNASDLIQLDPIKIITDGYEIGEVLANHNETLEQYEFTAGFESIITVLGVQLWIYGEHHFDHRRYWRLGSIVYKGHHCLIVQNAGREGFDFVNSYTVNGGIYRELVVDILNKIMTSDPLYTSIDLDVDTPNLTTFYQFSLEGCGKEV